MWRVEEPGAAVRTALPVAACTAASLPEPSPYIWRAMFHFSVRVSVSISCWRMLTKDPALRPVAERTILSEISRVP